MTDNVQEQIVRQVDFGRLPDKAVAAPADHGDLHSNLDFLMDVTLQTSVELGRTEMTIRDVLALTPGSVIELNKVAGEPVDILINGKPMARGEVVVIDDMFGVRVTDIIPPSQRVRNLR